MEYYIIGAIILLIIGGIIYSVMIKHTNNKILEKISSLIESKLDEINPNIQIVKNNDYDILMEVNGKKYLVKVLVHFINKEVVITNRNTWIIYQNGQLDIKNRINVMTNFMDIPIDEDTEKIVVFYPSIYLLKMYINENEMVILKSNDQVHNTTVISYHDFPAYLDILKQN